MSAATPLITEQVTRRFGDHIAVNGVSLTLDPGEITALIGSSGSGKTTLLRLLAGMERPDGGRILSGTTPLSAPGTFVPIERRRIGLVFQDFALFPHLNARENVMFGLRHLPKADRAAHADSWLDRLGLSHRREAYPHQLSGGEQQRTAIARALAPEPVAILLDEPFSGLDPTMRDQVRDAALDAIRAAQIPALLVTHDASEALVHADQIAIIDAGRILQTGAPEQLYRAPTSLEAARALGPVHQIRRDQLPTEWTPHVPASATTVWYRPEALQIAEGNTFTITRTRLAGPVTELELKLDNGCSVYAACQLGTSLQAGDRIGLSLDPDLLLVFPDRTT